MNAIKQLNNQDVKKRSSKQMDAGTPEKIDFEATVDKFETPLLRYAGHLIGTTGHDIEDVVQEAFLRLHKKLNRDGLDSIQNLPVWLYRVTHNIAMDTGRKRSRDKKAKDALVDVATESESASEMEILGQMIRREVSERAMEELSKLPGDLRHVVLLKVIQGMTMSQIAEVLGISASNVCYRLGRALRILSQRLKEAGLI